MEGSSRRERKVVTVLFADLVGFTARVEELDPEDVEAILRPYHERLRSELERFGGTVEKFIGDAVMALFGAPVAHEDDPERAVRAALAICDWAREEESVRVRVAVNTGEVLVNLAARPESGEGMASGDVVNTTARLQSAASVNGVLVGETTYRATRDVIEYHESDPVVAKGKAAPVRVWEALQARSRFGVDLFESRTPLVGRMSELGLLRDTFARVRRESSPQLVTLVGVPGIGKSRLVFELFESLKQGPELTYWRQGRSIPYGEGVAFWALAEMVKAQAGIFETDTLDGAAEKLAHAVRTLVDDQAEAQRIEAHLRLLVGGQGDAAQVGDRRGENFAAWRQFFEAMAEQRPLVLVFEDLQWAGDDLLDFVDYLVDWARDVSILVVCTARPELLERRPAWGGGKTNALTLSLSPLADDETASLFAGVLGRSVMPADRQADLLARAGGNPLYAEQFARMLSERGSSEEVPETVQGIIAARLDLLPAEEKELLQDAAVVGKVFWVGALLADALRAEEVLHSLERKEFVQRARRSSVAGQTEYAFRHLLVRDVAYGQIPRAARGDKHRLAAEWIESLGRPEDHAEMLAHHYLAAMELAAASGRPLDSHIAARTERAVRAAGDRAFALNAFGAAARFYERALELCSDEADRRELLFRLAQALHVLGDDRRFELLEEVREELVAAGKPSAAAVADALLAEAWWQRAQGEKCFECLERAKELVADQDRSPEKVRVLSQVGRYLALAGRNEEALRINSEVFSLAGELGLEESRAMALSYIGLIKVVLGDFSGFRHLEDALELAVAVGASAAGGIHANIAAMQVQAGLIEAGYRNNLDAQKTCEQLGHMAALRHLRGWKPLVSLRLGRWDAALSEADAFIAECEAGSPHVIESRARGTRAEIRLARGDEEGADDDIARALALSRRVKEPHETTFRSTAARIYFQLGRLDESRAVLDETLAACGGTGLAAAWVYELAWIADALGRADPLRELLAKGAETMPAAVAGLAIVDGDFIRAAEVFEQAGGVTDAAFARLRAAEQLVSERRRLEADDQLQRALAFYRSVGAARYIREGEALLAATA